MYVGMGLILCHCFYRIMLGNEKTVNACPPDRKVLIQRITLNVPG